MAIRFVTEQTKEIKPSSIASIKIKLASPDKIREWSYGEVTKPETINYRSFKPEKDGLFCEKIFGPVKDWECSCGKYKRVRYRGVVCDKCEVEVTQSKVRRERMGHIELAVPVGHIWYIRGAPSRVGNLLHMPVRDIEKILYYENYVVINPGGSHLAVKDLLTEDEYIALKQEHGEGFVAEMGAGAIKKLLQMIDLDELSNELRTQVRVETSPQKKKEKLKRLKIVEAFRYSDNKPEWMILDVLPVIPPDLRPLVPLEGGRFATSDLNDLYRRVINRNNRLKKLIELRAPEVILRNEKRMLQEAVDSLLDNGRRVRAVRGRANRLLKSLSDIIRGKQGRFRQNLLGKRVDYSGRTVIVVGPELKLHQCGLPKTMAMELFKPFIIKKLEEKGYAQTVKSAKRLVERELPQVWDILEEVIKDHYVLLNRAPTLHRLGIQAFEPVLIEGKAIRIHPLVCAGFNADFDGDQMAVHVPLCYEAQLEARVLMLSSNNIFSPAHGRPLASPSQDIVLGCYYLTQSKDNDIGEGKIFANPEEAIIAYENKIIGLHAKIKVRNLKKKGPKLLETTVGRIIFNETLPDELEYINYVCNKSKLTDLVAKCHRKFGNYITVKLLDEIKSLGFKYATLAGVTVGIEDMLIPPEKKELVERAQAEVEQIMEHYRRGVITDSERYNKIIDIWNKTTQDVADVLFRYLKNDQDGFNPIYMMTDSGARGSKEQVRQLSGMRGLMAKPQKKLTGQVGEIIESPIISSFREGLSVVQYFISTHGSRKGLADTALKTADAGYLTRRLVDVANDAIISTYDCGTIKGIEMGALKEGEEVIEPLSERIIGRVAAEDIVDPLTDEVLVKAGELIDEESAEKIDESSIEKVLIRSVLTCEARRGICAKCYGRNLATGKMVSIGEAIGVIAAQSIGEPGTQLTLRTFHIGGTASRIEVQSKKETKHDGIVRYVKNVKTVIDKNGNRMAIGRNAEISVVDKDNRTLMRYRVPYGSVLLVDDGEVVKKGQMLFKWDPYIDPILTEHGGTISWVEIEKGKNLIEEFDEVTNLRQRKIVEHRDQPLNPVIRISDKNGNIVEEHPIPNGAYLPAGIDDGMEVEPGEQLIKIPRITTKTKDITGGLPRVSELFEARKPKDAAILSEISGTVYLGGQSKKQQTIIVRNESGEEVEHPIPHGKHILVHVGDHVEAGDKLCEGPVNPHDILRVKGDKEVQRHLVNEIQEVYRMQGVKINDKHIEVIVRQMLRKVRVKDPGDTQFLEGEQVDRVFFHDENEKVVAEGGEPATFEPLLLGITRAALGTESFLSAASFQETTRVLTEAAIRGKTDYLRGLKENLIIGNLISAGTGISKYRNMIVKEKGTE